MVFAIFISHHKIQCLRENFSAEKEGDKEKDSWRRYCHQTNDGLSIPLIRSWNLVFFNSEHFKNSLVLQKHAWSVITDQHTNSPTLKLQQGPNKSGIPQSYLTSFVLHNWVISWFTTLGDYCFQNKLRSLLYQVREATSSILVRQRHVLWGRYVLFQTQPLNTNASDTSHRNTTDDKHSLLLSLYACVHYKVWIFRIFE